MLPRLLSAVPAVLCQENRRDPRLSAVQEASGAAQGGRLGPAGRFPHQQPHRDLRVHPAGGGKKPRRCGHGAVVCQLRWLGGQSLLRPVQQVPLRGLPPCPRQMGPVLRTRDFRRVRENAVGARTLVQGSPLAVSHPLLQGMQAASLQRVLTRIRRLPSLPAQSEHH